MLTALSRAAASALPIAIHAPVGRDAELTEALLTRAEIACATCRDAAELAPHLEAEAGAVLLTAEALTPEVRRTVRRALDEAPPWSDLPILLFVDGALGTDEALRLARTFGDGANVALLERPLRPSTLVSAVRAALKARERQIEVRDLLDRLRHLNDALETQVHERTAELVEAYEALAEREGFLQGIYASAGTAIFTVDVERDEDGAPVFRYAGLNPFGQRLTGLSQEEMLGHTPHDLVPRIPAEVADRVVRQYRRCLETGERMDYEEQLPSADGRVEWWLTTLTPTRDDAGTTRRLVGTSVCITERKEAEERVRELSRSLTLAEQEERERISLVLHDGLQQLLFGLQLKLQVLDGDDAAGHPDVRAEVHALLDEAMQTTRTLSVELHPPVLSDDGLDVALDWLAQHMHERYGLAVEVEAEAPCPPLDRPLLILVTQSVRELLFNVVKHAETDLARVRLQAPTGRLHVEVTDEGTGFTPENGEVTSSGLTRLRERFTLLGGHFELDARPGEGTRVLLEVPVGE